MPPLVRRGTAVATASILIAAAAAGCTSGEAAPADSTAPSMTSMTQASAAPVDSTPPSTTPDPAVIGPDQDITFDSGGVTIHASYRGPVDGASAAVPAVVIIDGTGGSDRNGDTDEVKLGVYKWLADFLAAQGVASVRYDKLGTGATGMGPYAADPQSVLSVDYDQIRIQPARDALSYLAEQPGVDADKLLVLGHSEGGITTLGLAADPGDGPEPAGLLLIEPGYARYNEMSMLQIKGVLGPFVESGTLSAEDEQTLLAWVQGGLDEIRNGTPPYPDPGPLPLPDATGDTAAVQEDLRINFFGSDPQQTVITHSVRSLYGKGLDAIDPLAIAPTIDIPVFITCGTKDFNTPCGDGTPNTGVKALAASFSPGIAEFVELDNVVHALRDVGDADPQTLDEQLAYPYSTQLETELAAYLTRFTK